MRYLRVLKAMLTRPMPREAVDSTAGASNGPDLISRIRDLFPAASDLHEYIRCDRINFIDRDGKPCRPGVYSYTEKGRRLVIRWFASLRKGGAF
jgi:hypothetical protein